LAREVTVQFTYQIILHSFRKFAFRTSFTIEIISSRMSSDAVGGSK